VWWLIPEGKNCCKSMQS